MTAAPTLHYPVHAVVHGDAVWPEFRGLWSDCLPPLTPVTVNKGPSV